MKRLVGFLLFASVAASAAPPRGRRTPRPQATHVVVLPCDLTFPGAMASLRPGVVVAAKGSRGRVEVTLAGELELRGIIDAGVLGMCAGRDVDLADPDGRAGLGKLRDGALVRLIGQGRNGAIVETVGEAVVRGLVPRDALTTACKDFAVSGTWSYRLAEASVLHENSDLGGKDVARLEPGARVEFLEQVAGAARVETYGAVVVSGWLSPRSLKQRDKVDEPQGPVRLIAPTHEMFVDGPVFARANGKERIGTARGGALLEVVADSQQGELVKVNTPGPITMSAWVRAQDLRQLDTRLFERREGEEQK